jgi:hypothetical protein
MGETGGTSEAGEASSLARVGATEVTGAGPLVRLPHDSLAVEWWLARRAIEADGGVAYATEGVLALWPEHRAVTNTWTFGLEFEFAVADAGWVASELHAAGLCAAPGPVAYHAERQPGFWAVEHDGTVTSVFNTDDGSAAVVVGGEVVSPPLRDTPEAWQQVATVLEVLRRCGAEINRTCGLHVHIGAESLRDPHSPIREGGGSPALRGAHEPDRNLLPALSRLAMLTSVCFEDLVFRMASAEGGRHRGQAFFYRHCRPLERPLQPSYASLSELAGALGLEGASRRAALNLTNVGDPKKDTLEFRHSNGTLDGRVVQSFVRLCIALVGAARWSPEAALLPPEPLGAHVDRARLAPAPASDGENDPSPLWRFLAAACPNGLSAEAAASLLWLYRRGAWQPGLKVLAAAG